MRTRRLVGGPVAGLALVAGLAAAQTPPETVVFDKLVLAGGPLGAPGGGEHTVEFVFAHESVDGRLVKGAPYSAEAVTEIVQTLADGNRILRKTTASVARDGLGRTRRDHALGAVGPFVAADEPHRMAFLNDPVAGVDWVLDFDDRTAFKHPRPEALHGGTGGEPVVVIEEDVVVAPAPDARPHSRAGAHPAPLAAPRPLTGPLDHVFERRLRGPLEKGTTETLGTQTIEGVESEGTRTTVTIPAGEIGNERPIEIVSERWYSPELQVVVTSRHSDPRFGETTYRLTSLTRGEPAASLFEVPADFTVRDAPPGPIRRKVIKDVRKAKTKDKVKAHE